MDLLFYLLVLGLGGGMLAMTPGTGGNPYSPEDFGQASPQEEPTPDADTGQQQPDADWDDEWRQDVPAEEPPAIDAVPGASEPALPPETGDGAGPGDESEPAPAQEGTSEHGAAAEGGAGFPSHDYAAETDPPGGMTTALEVRPILSVTKPQWLSLREFDGHDLLYFTNLLAWRCGLHEIGYSVNGGEIETLPMEPCHTGEGTPNAMTADDIPPYLTFPEGDVQTVHVEILYDDLGRDSADYARPDILMH